jgi:AcrR family transcriptional regulator
MHVKDVTHPLYAPRLSPDHAPARPLPLPMSVKAQQSETTRTTLIRVARDLFTELGYADTPTEEIVRRASMTRGALYHQYKDKQDLFRAVFETVEADLNAQITAAAMRETDPVSRMRAGVSAFLDAVLDPTVRRIVVLDGPSVLGLQTWRRIDDAHSFKQVSGALHALVAAGLLLDQPIDALAHLVVGALNQAALAMAVADDVTRAREEFGIALGGVLDALLHLPAKPRRTPRKRPRVDGASQAASRSRADSRRRP